MTHRDPKMSAIGQYAILRMHKQLELAAQTRELTAQELFLADILKSRVNHYDANHALSEKHHD
jgi:hypothetical protein